MSHSGPLVTGILAYFAVLLIFAKLKSREMNGRMVFLFRAFFPSWKFFEDIEQAPLLYIRTELEGRDFSEWSDGLGKAERSLSQVVFNPKGNLRLACNSLLQQLMTDLELADESNPKSFENVVSYQLTKNLARRRVLELARGKVAVRFQFKLCLLTAKSPYLLEDMMISPIYEI